MTPLLSSLSLIALAFTASVQRSTLDALESLSHSRYHRVHSQIVGRDYHVYVAVPESYESETEKTYPVVYLLDGGALYPMLAAYYRYLRLAEEVPELIIVGISYGTDDWREGNDRGRDYTAPAADAEHWGGAGQFQQFLERELLPLVASRYRARADRRVIFGQSLGGQFVLYTAQTRPGLFWGHIASNPALHRNLNFYLAPAAAHAPGSERPRLFVGTAEYDEPRFKAPVLEWIRHWTTSQNRPWDIEVRTLA